LDFTQNNFTYIVKEINSMWSTKRNRVLEIAVIVVFGAIVSVINTILLRENLLKEVKRIAKNSELNIVNSKVTDINTRMKMNSEHK
jgi:hypothetical protein